VYAISREDWARRVAAGWPTRWPVTHPARLLSACTCRVTLPCRTGRDGGAEGDRDGL